MNDSQSPLRAWVAELAHWLPTQGTLSHFIHHNTLHAFQTLPFFDAMHYSSQLLNARTLLPLSEYVALYRSGKISEPALTSALAQTRVPREDLAELKKAFLTDSEETAPARTSEGIRARWRSRHHLEVDTQTHPLLFKLASQFLDQGISRWTLPYTQEGLYGAVRRLVAESFAPLGLFSSPIARQLLSQSPELAMQAALDRIVGNPQHARRYLLEMMLAHPGWSGMMHVIEQEPHQLRKPRPVRLFEFCALELILEVSLAESCLGKEFAPITHVDEHFSIPTDGDTPSPTRSQRSQQIWQQAYENTYGHSLLHSLSELSLSRSKAPQPTTPEIQSFFCIDDRECSLRRHLEATNPHIETFGVAGFFGIDCVFQGADDAISFKHCPAPVKPGVLIREKRSAAPHRVNPPHLFAENHSNTFLSGWLMSPLLGLSASLRLAASVFRPSLEPTPLSALKRANPEANLLVHRARDAEERSDYRTGYTAEEMATRVEGVLKSTGALAAPLAPLVVVLGHGSSSNNNPYFAAYDCGACSGQPGAPNARAFAIMANDPQVRKHLAGRGHRIPETTWFVGGIHDTTRDEVKFYDTRLIPQNFRERFEKFENELAQALTLNAKERTRRFELVAPTAAPERAHRSVKRRSVAIFEPRPEYNHVTNTAAIVGRRQLTRGLFLDRRAFLNSYDPHTDPSGEILTQILSAVVPVCGGINLEYYFSRVDNERLGAGSKLAHNVQGLIGVSNGVEGDLRTGLPAQMVEIHDPLRLHLIVEQEPSIALAAIQKNPAIYEWVRNQWVRYYSVTPDCGLIHEFIGGQMVALDLQKGAP